MKSTFVTYQIFLHFSGGGAGWRSWTHFPFTWKQEGMSMIASLHRPDKTLALLKISTAEDVVTHPYSSAFLWEALPSQLQKDVAEGWL